MQSSDGENGCGREHRVPARERTAAAVGGRGGSASCAAGSSLVTDRHVRVLPRVARRARVALSTHPAVEVAPATEREAEADRYPEQAATAADTRLLQSVDRRRGPAPAEHSVAELDALAAHARQRLAL